MDMLREDSKLWGQAVGGAINGIAADHQAESRYLCTASPPITIAKHGFKPSWWSDEQLLSLTDRATVAAPNDGRVWHVRAEALRGRLPVVIRLERSSDQVLEAALCYKRATQLGLPSEDLKRHLEDEAWKLMSIWTRMRAKEALDDAEKAERAIDNDPFAAEISRELAQQITAFAEGMRMDEPSHAAADPGSREGVTCAHDSFDVVASGVD